MSEAETTEAESAFHGDILEAVLSRLPLLHLFPALRVSKSWNHAVFSSLRNLNRPKPWLILHPQCSRSSSVAAFSAYDPRSALWLQINHPPNRHDSVLRSSHHTLLYTLSPSQFSFSLDPLHLTWHHADPPRVWRTDPVVSVVGRRVVVAGGVCEFEDDPLAVEIYDLDTGKWETCEPMPLILKDSAASTWLSVASDERKVYVMEKHTSLLYCFDPESKTWSGPYNLRGDRSTCSSVIGFCRRGLIVVGLCGDSEETRGVKFWALNDCESLESCREIGLVPEELTRKLKGGGALKSIAIAVSSTDDLVYVYNPDESGEVVTCEVDGDGGGVWQWGSVRKAVRESWRRVLYTCSNVGLVDLQMAENEGFTFTAVGY